MAARNPSPVDRYGQLLERVEREFARIQARNADRMQCRAGCSDCCRSRLSVAHVERAFMERGLKTLPGELRRELAAATTEPGREMCPALDDAGRCRIYEQRPLICRSFGVPLRHRRSLALIQPPVTDVCDLNFVGESLHVLSEVDVIDQTDLVAELTELDREYCKRKNLSDVVRIPIAKILSELQ